MKNFKSTYLKAYFICGTQDVAGRSLIDVVDEALQAGITAYQFRDKGPQSTLRGEDRLTVAQALRKRCAAAGVPFIVDDDVALAQQVKADGIHVGQSDQRIQSVIDAAGDTMFVGLSCSNEKEIEAANAVNGIDYYGSGPVFPTGSKADADPVIGLDGLSKLVELTTRPIVAIGGITANHLRDVTATGAKGSSVISLITQSTDVFDTVKQMLEV